MLMKKSETLTVLDQNSKSSGSIKYTIITPNNITHKESMYMYIYDKNVKQFLLSVSTCVKRICFKLGHFFPRLCVVKFNETVLAEMARRAGC